MTTTNKALDGARRARLEARAEVIKALAHPARLAFVEELAQGERCVCDLHALVGGDLSTASRHLSVLKAAGVVVDERRGTQVFYRLRVPCVVNFFECIENVVRATAAGKTAALAPARARRGR